MAKTTAKVAAPPSSLIAKLEAEFCPVEETEYAEGFNAGIREAVKITRKHEDDARKMIADHTTVALAGLRADGKKTGGLVPYGQRVVKDGQLAPEPREQRTIRLAVKFRDLGWSYRAIAAELAERGLTSRAGKKFHAAQVHQMVKRAK